MSLVAAATADAQQITLQQAIALAQKQSYQSTAVTATRDAARSRSDAFGAKRLPQIALTGTAPLYQKDIQAVIQQDGSTLFVPVQQTRADAGLTVSQLLPITGGSFSVTSTLQRYDRTGTNASRTWTSSPVTFAIQQPLFRPNALRWDSRIADVQLTSAERQFVESREGVAITATEAFFDLYIARRSLDAAVFNAATNDTLYNLNKGRLEIGKIGENDLLQSELAVLRARSALDNAKLEFERREAGFRLAVNMPPGSAVDIQVPFNIPEFEVDTHVAVIQALQNRAQMTDLELQGVLARRRVAEAKLGDGPGANIIASVGFNQTANDMNLAYQDLLQAQRFRLELSIPLINWGARGAAVQAARSDEKRINALARQAREQLAQDAYFASLQIGQARRNLMVSAKADTVAAKRFEVAYNRYVIGRIGPDNLYIAQNEKDQAFQQYLQALRNYWVAYYRLRQTTLYDFETKTTIR